MYRRGPTGDYLVGVCTNTLCAEMGGDAIFETSKNISASATTRPRPTATVTLQHIECNAACDFAPVVMVNWEFYDNQTTESARELVDSLRRQAQGPHPRRTAVHLRETSRILAGLPDERPDQGQGGAGAATLAGLKVAKEHGMQAPPRRAGGPVMTGVPGDTADPGASAATGTTPSRGPWTTYRRHDGYKAMKKALAMEPDAVIGDRQGFRVCAGAAARASRRGPSGRSSRRATPARPPSRITWWSTPTSPNPVPAKTSG